MGLPRRRSELAQRIEKDFSAPAGPILLAEGDAKPDVVVTFPLNTTATSRGFLEPKYTTLRTITFEGFGFSNVDDDEAVLDALRNLPSGFVKDPFFGLGLNYDLRYLIETVEEIEMIASTCDCGADAPQGFQR